MPSAHLAIAALAPFLDSLIPMFKSYEAAIDAYKRTRSLYKHALARGCSHPGVEKFGLMISKAPSRPPHGTVVPPMIAEFKGLDVKDDEKIHEWKRRFEPLAAKIGICERKLREILDEADIRAFAIAEEAVVAEEKASV